jgi:PAS domain S-box-containing protein
VSLLDVDAIDAYYGESHILRDLSLTVEEGEICALLGRNGAGKTTTLRSIAGAKPPQVRDGSIRFKGEEITGYSSDEAIGQTPNILQSGEHDEEYYRELWETVLSGEVWEEEIVDRRKCGERYHAEQTIAPVSDETGEIDRFIAFHTGLTDRKEREQALV